MHLEWKISRTKKGGKRKSERHVIVLFVFSCYNFTMQKMEREKHCVVEWKWCLFATALTVMTECAESDVEDWSDVEEYDYAMNNEYPKGFFSFHDCCFNHKIFINKKKKPPKRQNEMKKKNVFDLCNEKKMDEIPTDCLNKRTKSKRCYPFNHFNFSTPTIYPFYWNSKFVEISRETHKNIKCNKSLKSLRNE